MKRIIMFIAVGCLAFCNLTSQAFAASSKEVIASLAKQTGMTEKQVGEFYGLVFTTIAGELKAGRPVTVKNFGRFYTKARDARKGRNPRTGEAIQIPAKTYPRFSSSDKLKEALNENLITEKSEATPKSSLNSSQG